MPSKEQIAITRRLKCAILADNKHQLKKLFEKCALLPMYHFLEVAYKTDSEQKPKQILKAYRKINQMLLEYHDENQHYQTLEALSKQSKNDCITVNDEALIRHFSHALQQITPSKETSLPCLSRPKKALQHLIDDISLTCYQHLKNGRFAEHFNRMVGQPESTTMLRLKSQLQSSKECSEVDYKNQNEINKI